jgi:hypothetical protein
MVSGMSKEREHFLPIRRVDLERLLLDEAGMPAEQRQELRDFIAILVATIHDDYHQRLERLKSLYDPVNPDRDTMLVEGGVAADEKALIAEMESLLTSANYRRLPAEELNQALNEESVFQVRLHTQLDDFAELIIFHRGRRNRNEVQRGWFGRQKLLSVDYFSRVAIYARFKDQAWFDAPIRRKRKRSFKPGTAILKLFQNIPCADIEMLMPNAEVRMRPKDHLMLAIPAIAGGIGVLLKFAATVVVAWFIILAWVGLREHRPEDAAKDAAALVGFGLALVAIGGFAWRQFNNFKNRKLRFMKELADNLYYRNLDNNGGVFHRLLDEAEEEDAKEALLAYVFLLRAGQPVTQAELDGRIETWFSEHLKLDVDFEVDDALDKLGRFKLAVQDGDQWSAVPLTEAKRILDERWDNKFTFA